MPIALLRHPASAGGEGAALTVEALRPGPGLSLFYGLTGAGGVRLPAPAPPRRADELWRRTCFEAFVGTGDGRYYEFNLSPSREWAAYRFDDYRAGMAEADVPAPEIVADTAGDAFTLRASLELAGLADLNGATGWRVSITAVIEDVAGRISYWAIRHAPGKPDFHDASTFTLDLIPDA